MKKARKNTAGAKAISFRDVASISLIIFWLDKLSNKIYSALIQGFFGKIFTAYSAEQIAFENGFLRNYFYNDTKFKKYFRRFWMYLSKAFETSFFLSKAKKYLAGLLSMPLKAYGISLFSFGVYTVLIYFIRWMVPGLNESGIDVVITGVLICIIVLPMLLSSQSLAEAVGSAVITRAIFSDVFGFRKDSFDVERSTARGKSNVMLVLGLILGLLTLFVHPIAIIGGVIAFVGVILVLAVPEIGVLAIIFSFPFFSFYESPVIILGLMTLLITISYFIKLIRGKRILKLELLDLSVVLFLLILYFSGTITAGGITGYNEVLISVVLMFGYFLVVNLIRTEKWLKRCVLALVSSATVVALIGIFQYILGMFDKNNAWLDKSLFSNIKGRVTSVFENPNVLATYLALIFPFALFLMTLCKLRKEKLLCAFSIVGILVCLIFTWSRGAWLAVLISLLFYALLRSKRTLRFLILGCFFIPFLPFILPDSITRRFMSIGNFSDSSTMYRFYTWKGVFRSIKEYFVSGVGYGMSAYEQIYPQYAYAGIEAAEHSHSLYLQILFGMGIGGFIAFSVILFLSAQMNFEYLKRAKDQSSKIFVIAAMSAILAALIMGLFDFVWYNYRVFFLFWIVLGLACACVRIGYEEQRRHGFVRRDQKDAATLDINI